MFKPYETIPVEVRPRLNPVGQCLMDGADRIRKHGHAKKVLRSPEGGYCIVGALYDVKEKVPFTAIYNGVAAAAFRAIEAKTCDSILGWNDAPERTAEEVIAVLESAALEQVVE